MNTFEQKILNTIKNNNLLSANDNVVVGVSGGVDSVVLLYILNKFSLNDILPLNIKVAHINHGIRKETAVRDAEFVNSLCDDLHINCYILNENVPEYAKRHKLTEEEAGRVVRYNFFNKLVGENGKIATAHHANDNVETVLMNLIRGTGMDGISGIKVRRDNIVRPLLYVKKSEIINYAKENSLFYVEDETNNNNDYTRNKIRNMIIPLIENNLNTSFIDSCMNSISCFDNCNGFINNITAEEIKNICNISPDEIKIDVNKFIRLEKCVQMKIIMQTANMFVSNREKGIRQSAYKEIANLFRASNGSSFKVRNLIYFKNGNHVILSKSNKDSSIIDITKDVKELEFCNKKFVVESVKKREHTTESNACFLPYEFQKDAVLRFCKDDDIVVFNDKNCMKINRYFKLKGIFPKEKEVIPVIASKNLIFWIDGIFTSKMETKTKEFLKISCVSK